MSSVIIDTSSIINFEKLFPGICNYADINGIVKRCPLDIVLIDLIENIIEALIFYDEIIIDKDAIIRCLGRDISMPLSELSYCKYIDSSKYPEEQVYWEIIQKFGLTPQSVSIIANNIPTDWVPFFDHHDNLSVKGFIYYEEAVYGTYYSCYVEEFLDSIYMNDGENSLKSIPKKIVYEIVRYLYYIYLQSKEKAQLVIHPSRDIIPQVMGLDNHLFDWVAKDTNQRLDNRLNNRISNLMQNALPIPFIASYILRRSKTPYDLFNIIDKVRNSKEAKRFRKAFNKLITIVKDNDISSLNDVKEEFNETILNWEENLNIIPGYRSKELTISLPAVVSFDSTIPYIGGNKIARDMLTFIHKTILNEDDYRRFRHLYQSIGFKRTIKS